MAKGGTLSWRAVCLSPATGPGCLVCIKHNAHSTEQSLPSWNHRETSLKISNLESWKLRTSRFFFFWGGGDHILSSWTSSNWTPLGNCFHFKWFSPLTVVRFQGFLLIRIYYLLINLDSVCPSRTFQVVHLSPKYTPYIYIMETIHLYI